MKKCYLAVKISDSEHAWLNQLAKRDRQTLAEFVRSCINDRLAAEKLPLLTDRPWGGPRKRKILTLEQRVTIRVLREKTHLSYTELGKQFGVARMTAYRAARELHQ